MKIVLDIETGPLPQEYLEAIMPDFKATRAKREEKVAEEIAEKKAKFIDDAALDPTTGQVLAIGLRYIPDEGQPVTSLFASGNERQNLLCWWNLWFGAERISDNIVTLPLDPMRDRIIGFNVADFDLPFLVCRAWILGIKVPGPFRDITYLERQNRVVDIMNVWKCGRYRNHNKSLNAISSAMGFGGKNTAHSQNFSWLWERDKEAALTHLRTDLIQTEAIYKRIREYTEISGL